MPTDPRLPEWRRFFSGPALLVAIAGATVLLMAAALASCAGSSAPSSGSSSAKAPMDVALDLGGRGIFYRGLGRIPRNFHSATSFKMDFDLAHGDHPAGGGIGTDAHAVLGDLFKGTGVYQPLENGGGVISLQSGRLLLRGLVSEDGMVLDGDWFLDGKPGGGFRIAPQGTIFL